MSIIFITLLMKIYLYDDSVFIKTLHCYSLILHISISFDPHFIRIAHSAYWTAHV